MTNNWQNNIIEYKSINKHREKISLIKFPYLLIMLKTYAWDIEELHNNFLSQHRWLLMKPSQNMTKTIAGDNAQVRSL